MDLGEEIDSFSPFLYLASSNQAAMETYTGTNPLWLKIIRWCARITGSLLVVFTVIFGIMNYIDGLSRNNGSPLSSFNMIIILLFIVWGIALAGLVIALWKEGLGGCISLVCFVIMPVLNLFNPASPSRRSYMVFLIFIIPSLLYIYYWWLTKDISQKSVYKES